MGLNLDRTEKILTIVSSLLAIGGSVVGGVIWFQSQGDSRDAARDSKGKAVHSGTKKADRDDKTNNPPRPHPKKAKSGER